MDEAAGVAVTEGLAATLGVSDIEAAGEGETDGETLAQGSAQSAERQLHVSGQPLAPQ